MNYKLVSISESFMSSFAVSVGQFIRSHNVSKEFINLHIALIDIKSLSADQFIKLINKLPNDEKISFKSFLDATCAEALDFDLLDIYHQTRAIQNLLF
ncbi:MAG: hypothetical protein A2Y40_07110 [Candidatus Margulisbacteria bacterium GWF2_35_9]|nr:MAG: hypothetical protein A2Y40_07110 [Candidatus Margulisbacteria bacterium GWF2_35_9]